MKFIKKNKGIKGNISILVILVLLSCSLMGILSIIFLNSLISYTDDSYSYYKAYYIAKAGLELSLTEINNSDLGFSQSIYSGSNINTYNFNCIGCHFSSKILGRSSILSENFWLADATTCSSGNALSLSPGGSMTIPMFYDNSNTFSQIFGDTKAINYLGDNRYNLSLIPLTSDNNIKMNIGVVFQSGSDILSQYLYMTGLQISEGFFKEYFKDFDELYGVLLRNDYNVLPYIVLSNSNDKNINFCITLENDILWPTSKYFISSVGEYMGKSVGLQAIYTQPTPSFLINPYIDL